MGHVYGQPPDRSRRAFMRHSAALSGILWAGSGALLALAPGKGWTLELGQLDAHAGRTLLIATRHIFPHPKLDDAVYALVVKDLDEAAADPAVRDLLAAGVAGLDHAAGGDWLALGSDEQLALLRLGDGQPFFEKVRATAVVSLYNNELAFAHFGYEGEAFSKGGYLNRGFNDLNWLPAPDQDASPSV